MVLTEGYDNPAIDCVVIVRPTKSALLYTQMIGRGTRTFPTKKDCLILDVACISTQHDLVSFPSLFGLPLKQDGDKTLAEQIEEKESKLQIYGGMIGQGIEREEVDIFGRKPQASDPYSMGNLAWVQLQNGFRLYLGKAGLVNIYAAFDEPTKYRVFYRNKSGERREITRQPADLSWAFGLAESEARRVTGGNLTLVDKSARWRQEPASDKQIAKLAEYGIFKPELTKGGASDLLAQLFAGQRT
jgi:superfamily II DNA or RNA helicase